MEIKTILFTKENWLNSQLSVARFYGGLRLGNHEYMVMPDSGDLLRDDFVKYYLRLGRKRLIDILQAHNQMPDKELKEICEVLLMEQRQGEARARQREESNQPKLFGE